MSQNVHSHPWVPDQGDGTYRNPVLHADYSDPDVVRVGRDFYLTSSSFQCTPGLPILHSRDLVNWRLVNHALRELPDPRYAEVQPGHGVWAPSIRFHDGRFWIVFPTPDEGIYVTTAEDPLGEWSEPHLLMGGQGRGVAEYVTANLVFLNFLSPDLPGLFEGNRFTEVNGALWTLKIEVMFYLCLPVIGWALRMAGRARWALLLGLYAAGEAWRLGLPVLLDHPLAPMLARQLPGQMAFFASGIALWQVWELARSKPLLFGAGGLLLAGLSFVHPWLEPLRAAGLAGLTACIAFLPGPALNAARWGDISYGVYITHFPILQALAWLGVFAMAGHAAGFALSALLVIAASFALWHLVERPALRPSSHYRKVADKTEQD